MRVVLDTNVLVAGLRSKNGASFRVLTSVGTGVFETAVSVPLVLEYEEVMKRDMKTLGLSEQDVQDLLDYLCSVSVLQPVFFLWRPALRDPDDDMLLELAVAAECDAVVTHNVADCEQFGIAVMTPRQLLRKVGIEP